MNPSVRLSMGLIGSVAGPGKFRVLPRATASERPQGDQCGRNAWNAASGTFQTFL